MEFVHSIGVDNFYYMMFCYGSFQGKLWGLIRGEDIIEDVAKKDRLSSES